MAHPPAEPVPWLVFVIGDRSRNVEVMAQHWFTARELGAPKLGVRFDEVDAEREPGNDVASELGLGGRRVA